MAERPEDLNLPNAIVTRIIKDAIPEGVNVSKEARLAISKAASVFVLYATSCSNNFALKGKRKTISAQDVINAMEDMEFEQFMEPLKNCLEAYRSEQKSKKEANERKKKEKEEQAVIVEEEDAESMENDDNDDNDDEKDEDFVAAEEDEDDDDDESVAESGEGGGSVVNGGMESNPASVTGSVVEISDDD